MRAEDPLVSVVVPTYERVGFIAETVESVLAQDYPRIEIVLSDDGSADGTAEAVKRFGDEHPTMITALTVKHNTGLPANLNRGLQAATGELVARLDGDDVMLPGKLRQGVEALRLRPDAVACSHDAEVFDSGSGRVLGLFSELYNGRRGLRQGGVELLFDPTYHMMNSATMFRASAAPRRGWDERLRSNNDLLWHIELLRKGPVVGLQDALVRYRRHAGSMTAQPRTLEERLEEGLIAMAIVTARFPELQRMARRRSTGFLLAEAVASARRGQGRRAARLGVAAVGQTGPDGALREALRLAAVRLRRERARRRSTLADQQLG